MKSMILKYILFFSYLSLFSIFHFSIRFHLTRICIATLAQNNTLTTIFLLFFFYKSNETAFFFLFFSLFLSVKSGIIPTDVTTFARLNVRKCNNCKSNKERAWVRKKTLFLHRIDYSSNSMHTGGFLP